MDSRPSSSSSPTGDESLTLPLIPGLPDEIASLILISLPYSHRSRLRSTARAWRAFLSSASVAPLRRLLRLPPRHILCLFPSDPSVVCPFLFDPSATAWAPLPTLPCSPYFYGLSNFATLSLGNHLYVLGGSHFDARSYPLGLPVPSAAFHRLDLSAMSAPWTRLPDMLSPRGSFACAPISGVNAIIVAGGGSRHSLFPSSGTRMSSVEIFYIDSGEWARVNELPRYRSGCVGFFRRLRKSPLIEKEDLAGEGEEEFWVMGGYGDYRPLAGVVPANVYYRDVLVLGMRSGQWREVGDMWEDGERQNLGQVVVLDGADGELMGVFMLDGSAIFRYEFAWNRWRKESRLRRRVGAEESCGFVAMNGEVCVLRNPPEPRRRAAVLEIQAYDPQRKTWRLSTTIPPFSIDFNTAVFCTIQS